MSREQVIILGAGPPHRGSQHPALRTDKEGTPVLEWFLEAAGVSLEAVTFVGGYDLEAIRDRYPTLRTIEARGWEYAGSSASLLAAPLDVGAAALVAYSDVLLRPSFIASLRSGEAPATVGWDSNWRERFAGRPRESLVDREKVVMAGKSVVRLGPDIGVEDASGEFVGVVRLTPAVVEQINSERETLRRLLPIQSHLSLLIEALRASGTLVDGVDAAGDWAEMHQPADIAQFVLGTKADTLSRMRGLLRYSSIPDQITRSVAQWESDAEREARVVRDWFGDTALIVRSSTTHEDLKSGSNAGRFVSVTGVRGTKNLKQAVSTVAASYRSAGISAASQQILVQPMIEDVIRSGVALSRTLSQGAPWKVVEYFEGSATDIVTSGLTDSTRTLYIHRDSVLNPPHEGAARRDVAKLSGVLRALVEIEDLLGSDALDVEFAVDATDRTHVLQVRPMVTQSERRDAAFNKLLREARQTWDEREKPAPHIPGPAPLVLGLMPDWNPAEIIGTAPGQLSLDLYRRLITDEVWAIQRAQVGYRDVRPAPLLVNVAGTPYVDVRASFASFLPRGLEDNVAGEFLRSALRRLVEDPRLHDKVEFAVIPTCVDPDWIRWEKLLADDGHSVDHIASLRTELAEITTRILGKVEESLKTVSTLEQVSRAATVHIADPLVKAATLLASTAVYGTLPFAHLARAAFVAVSFIEGACASGHISAEGGAEFLSSVHTVSGQMTAEAAEVRSGFRGWDDFVGRWGHLRPGTYELMSPRYDSDPDRFLRPIVHSAPLSEPSGSRASDVWERERASFLVAIAKLGFPRQLSQSRLESLLQRAISGRESSKFLFTRNLSDALELIAGAWEDRGLDRTIVSDAPLALLLPDVNGRVAETEKVRDAAAEWRERRELAASAPLPPLLTACEDLSAFSFGADLPNFIGRDRVSARVVRLDDGLSPHEPLDGAIILLARADPGFDWIFGHRIAGLVTLFGGANSHMAIRCAEHGLPAAIGVGDQRFNALQAARRIELDPLGRTLRSVP